MLVVVLAYLTEGARVPLGVRLALEPLDEYLSAIEKEEEVEFNFATTTKWFK